MKKATLFMTLFLLLFTTILTVQAATPTAVRIQTIIQGSQPQGLLSAVFPAAFITFWWMKTAVPLPMSPLKTALLA